MQPLEKEQTTERDSISKGICSDCGRRTLVVHYAGEKICTRCIHSNEHLSQMIGWQ